MSLKTSTKKYHKLIENAHDVESLMDIVSSFQNSSLPQQLFLWKVGSKFSEIEADCAPKDLFRLKSYLMLMSNEPLFETMIGKIGTQMDKADLKDLLGCNVIDLMVS